jgi:hypothetical protein
MDHQEALRLGAAERYVLGELPAELRDQFEQHYFDCPSCAVDLKILTAFTSASRALFEEQAKAPDPAIEKSSGRHGWLSWLRPVIAAPAIAALAALVILQAVGTIPTIRPHAGEPAAQVYESTFRLQGATRGETISKISIRPGENFAVDFDFTPDHSFPRYQCDLIGPTGQTVLTFDIAGERANKELHVLVRGDKVLPGNYVLVFVGQDGIANSNPTEVQRIPFSVETQK